MSRRGPAGSGAGSGIESLGEAARGWFAANFPGGPTDVQRRAWPAIAAGENALLLSPTGTGKTLAAFLAIIDRLIRERGEGKGAIPGVRCVYVSPLRSLGYDIGRNLEAPLRGLGAPIRVAIRTGDTTPHQRRKQRDLPPELLITTPESLSLLLSQPSWRDHWRPLSFVILDELHAVVGSKRGADLMASVERLCSLADADPARVGLSATCRPPEVAARFLVGEGRACRVIEAAPPEGAPPLELGLETLQVRGESPDRAGSYKRLLYRLRETVLANRSTVIFANTRAFTERITHDLRPLLPGGAEAVAAHHSALDAARRREVESALQAGTLRAVVTSTSLELGVDIGTADVSVLVGLPGSVARCLQRVGRAGHSVEAATRGLLLAATSAELVGGAVTVDAARDGRIEPLRPIRSPLDVLCQQLIGMSCLGDWPADDAYALLRRSAPFADLPRGDFNDCLAFLAGELASPAGAWEPEPGANPRWTSPRLWKSRGHFGVRGARVVRWFRTNLGTIHSEESMRVVCDGADLGTLESSYAERLQRGDPFVLDGRALEFVRMEGLIVHAKASAQEPSLPRWTSDRQGLSNPLARDAAAFRAEAADRLAEGPESLRAWLAARHRLDEDASHRIGRLIAAQEQVSEVPRPGELLVEEWPHPTEEAWVYAFHAPLGRSAVEALGRAVAARVGRAARKDLALGVADLGFSLRVPLEGRLGPDAIPTLLALDGFEEAVLEGIDRGDLLARRFRFVASTGLMVLRNPEGGRTRVGGMLWVSQKLYPLVRAACPDHPLLRETRREVLDDLLDAPGAREWLAAGPRVRRRSLDAPSPFAAAWIDPAGPEPLRFEPPAAALHRLHARLMGASSPQAS
jgi:ATP-dependent Lhr-like helicase